MRVSLGNLVKPCLKRKEGWSIVRVGPLPNTHRSKFYPLLQISRTGIALITPVDHCPCVSVGVLLEGVTK